VCNHPGNAFYKDITDQDFRDISLKYNVSIKKISRDLRDKMNAYYDAFVKV
jgi:hypothetical protein